MSIPQNSFLQQVAYHLDLPFSHPLYKGLEGIPEIENPDLSNASSYHDFNSSELCGTMHDNDNFYVEKQLYELFRKAQFPLGGVDPHENAVSSFLDQVAVSAGNNQRFSDILGIPDSSPLWDNLDYVAHRRLLRKARFYCHVLTDHAMRDIRQNGIQPRFTDGSCQGSKNLLPKGNSVIERFSNACVSQDVSNTLNRIASDHCTRLILARGPFHFVEKRTNGWSFGTTTFELPFWALFQKRAHVVDKITLANFVPKTYLTERATFLECVGDIAVQCGIGDVLAASLAFNGYDVSTLPAHHAKLVISGSINELIATFDMKGGSENVYTNLGEYLLPSPLFKLCMSSRTNQVEVDGKRISYPNMATAGNGFCFPLETIIFLSLQMAVCDSMGLKPRIVRSSSKKDSIRKIVKNGYHNLCSTFGDDVIIPTRFSSTFIEFFDKLGIVLNLDKSFYTGNFRESCGTHALEGRDINCFNSKVVPTMENTSEIKKFLNGIRRFGYDNNHSRWRHPALSDLWFGLLGTSFGEPDDRIRSPDFTVNHGSNGDAGVLVPRTYTVTRYVTKTTGPYHTGFMSGRVVSNGIRITTAINTTTKRESYRMYKIRSVAAAGGYPIATQKFYVARYANKISFSRLLRENPVPGLPLFKLVGQGLLSGAGLIHPQPRFEGDGANLAIVYRDDEVIRYPEFFVRKKYEIIHSTVSADPSAFTNEEVNDLFDRVGVSFERTRLARISRENLKRKRLDAWETRRSYYQTKLLSLLRYRALSVEDQVSRLFS